jgi:hypothetical protein
MPRVAVREVVMLPFAYDLLFQAALAPARDDLAVGGYDKLSACGYGELLTPDQTSAKLKIAKQTLARWRVEGKGPKFVRLGNRVFYRAGDVEAFVTGHVFSSTAEADRTAA